MSEMKAFVVAVAAVLALTAPSHSSAWLINGSNSASASSWVAGAQGGYNWQSGSAVYGYEADLSFTGLKSSMSGGFSCTNSTGVPLTCPQDPAAIANTTSKVDWYGTLRGRLGWTSGSALFYGTGGLAYGKVELNSNFTNPPYFLALSSQTSTTKVGWVLGGGIEYMLRPNVTLNLGYQYVDLGKLDVAASAIGGGVTITQNANAHAQFQVVTLGLNWKFNTPTAAATSSAIITKAPPKTFVSMPWEGGYFGGHVGGAWGNDTSANYSTNLLPQSSDIRLKRDITLVGHLEDGLGLYSYRYLWSDTVYVGVMAQEVALIHPKAVVRDALDGYLRVNYGSLGIRLMTLPEWEARNSGQKL